MSEETLERPTLLVERLVVRRRKKVVFDERFRVGINIIRGQNGSGKSSIMDLMFFALGGDRPPLKREALQCDEVFAQVAINGSSVTLARDISMAPRRPMQIHWGTYEEAQGAAKDAWEQYPYAAGKNRESFTTVLFRALGIPNIPGEVGARITMHQILRLIYVDQRTSYDRIFREEDFDSALIRDVVGAYLCGFDDSSLYDAKLEVTQVEQARSAIASELTALRDVLRDVEDEMPLPMLLETLAQREAQRDRLSLRLRRLSEAPEETEELPGSLKEERDHLRRTLTAVRADLRAAQERHDALIVDIEDTKSFIAALERKAVAAGEADTVYNLLGLVEFDRCPACYCQLEESEQASVCRVCRNPLESREGDSYILEMKNELVLQIRESEENQARRNHELERLRGQIDDLKHREASVTRQIDFIQRETGGTMEAALAEVHRALGYIEREIEDLQRQVKLAQRLEHLGAKKTALTKRAAELRETIKERQNALRNRRAVASSSISAHTQAILREDLPREEGFSDAEEVEFSFEENRIWVDGRASFAASSMVFLKNALHLGILAASTANDFFRYPRLALFDNIEDKGMEAERSHRFQQIAVAVSEEIGGQHQIIMTTSTIDPELDNPGYTVGRYYTTDAKSLEL
jgi:DNA repair exonuclease SbcCD ATPase subunit